MVSVREMERRMNKFYDWVHDFLEGKIGEKEVRRKVNEGGFSSFELLVIAVALSKHHDETTRKSHRKRKVSSEKGKGNSSAAAAAAATTTTTSSDCHPPSNKKRRISNGVSTSLPPKHAKKAANKGLQTLLTSPEPNKPQKAKAKKAKKSRKKQQSKKSNKKKKKKITYKGPEIPPPLPDEFENKIAEEGGTDIKLVIQKPLYSSDVDPHLDRLLMPLSQIVSIDFLTEEEKANFESKVVALIDTRLEPAQIRLTRWDMTKKLKDGGIKSNLVYALNSRWKDLVVSNNLKWANIVQVWSFRVGLELRLALVFVEQGQAAAA